jgi:3-methyladenine DNA glycosylase Tag
VEVKLNQHKAACRYHDKEWGRPVYDDKALFELLVLEGAQVGVVTEQTVSCLSSSSSFDCHHLAA